MRFGAWWLFITAMTCPSCDFAQAGIIHNARTFASVTGGVDQPLTIDAEEGTDSADASITEKTPRAKTSLGEVGEAFLSARASDAYVGASVEFELKTSGFNPDSNFHVAGAGGIAQARWDDTIKLSLRPYIGFPLETLQENFGDLGDFLEYFVVSNHATYNVTSTGNTDVGSAEIVDFDLKFSLDIVGFNQHSTQLNGPDRFRPADKKGYRNYFEHSLVLAGYSLKDYQNRALNFPLDPQIGPLSISLEIWNHFSGRSGGNASVKGILNANSTSKILGVVFMNSQGQVAPTSSLFFTESASGHEYPLLDQLPEGFGPTAVPEPGTLTLAGLGAVGLLVGRLRRRWRKTVD